MLSTLCLSVQLMGMGFRSHSMSFSSLPEAGFFDRRVNEVREWCSDEHMRCAATSTVMVCSELTSQLGLRYRMVLRTLARRVRHGLDERAISIAVGTFANIRVIAPLSNVFL
jgi:hypothetical protein